MAQLQKIMKIPPLFNGKRFGLAGLFFIVYMPAAQAISNAGNRVRVPRMHMSANGLKTITDTATANLKPVFVPDEIIVSFTHETSEKLVAQQSAGYSVPQSGLSPGIDKLRQKFHVREMKSVLKDVGAAVEKKLKQLRNKDARHLSVRDQRLLKRLESVDGRWRQSAQRRVYKMKLDLEKGRNLDEALKTVRHQPDVEWAEPNFLYHTQATIPNDSLFGSQSWLNTINAPQAWDITTGSPDVVIAVVDVGVDWRHPDLKDNIWTNADEIPGDDIDNDANGYIDDVRGWDFVNVDSSLVAPGENYGPPDNDPMDFNGHGTHVAGIIGSKGNNGIGVAGVNWNAKIMPLRAGYSGKNGGGSLPMDAIISALNYAAANGADVINMSFGSYDLSNLLTAALEDAYAAGCILVAAAGNNSSPLRFYPASYKNVISVAASQDKFPTNFTNYGQRVDILAPGMAIWSTYPKGEYLQLSGTSMASPAVAGIIGLIIAAHPTLTRDQIVHQLLTTCTDLPGYYSIFRRQLGAGFVNAERAVGAFYEGDFVNCTNFFTRDPAGDDDDLLEANETFEMTVSVKNWSFPKSFQGVLRTNDPFLRIMRANADFGMINSYRSKDNFSMPFLVAVANTAPRDHAAQVFLDISSAAALVHTDTLELPLAPLWGNYHVLTKYYSSSEVTKALPNGRLLVVTDVDVPGQEINDLPQGIFARFREADGTWGLLQRISSNSFNSHDPAVAIDNENNCYVAFYQYDGNSCNQFYVAKFDNAAGAWTPGEKATSNVMNYFGDYSQALVAQPGGKLHLVWRDIRNGQYGLYDVYYDGNSWHDEVMLRSSASEYPWNISITQHSDGASKLFYETSSGAYLRNSTDTGWDSEIILPRSYNQGPVFQTGDAIYRLANDFENGPLILQQFRNNSFPLSRILFGDMFNGQTPDARFSVLGSIDENNMRFLGIGTIFDPDLGHNWGIRPFMYGKEMENGNWLTSHIITSFKNDFRGNLNPLQIAVDGSKHVHCATLKSFPYSGDFSFANMGNLCYLTTSHIPSSLLPSRPTVEVTVSENASTRTILVNALSSHPQGIGRFEYAIGTSPGAYDVKYWKFVDTNSRPFIDTIEDYDVIDNQPYYISVRAHSNGVYGSSIGVSNVSALPMEFTITASASNGGTIAPSGTIPVQTGTSRTFSITPSPGYQIADVLADNISQGAITSYTFSNVTANHMISASFKVVTMYKKLRGIAFGTSPAWKNGPNTFDKAGDGYVNTFFDYSLASGGYTGIDLGAGAASAVNKIRFYPRINFAGRMSGGKFQGSNSSTRGGFTDLYTLPSTPVSSAWTEVALGGSSAFRYLRYLSPTNGYCNIAEMEFYTTEYTITASAGANGAISPCGGVLVNGGASKTFTITPNGGYRVDAVIVDGVSNGVVTTYTFTNVTANHAISATFKGGYRNLAVGNTASASSEIAGGTYSAAKMNDGNKTTRWSASAATFPQWAKIDLGSQYNISEVEMMFAFAGAAGGCYDFTVGTSSDNVNWTTRVNQNPNWNTAQTQRYGLGANARYVRITITGAPGSNRASLYEFRVFGQ
jgi:subtilisin family serine protease